MRTAPTKRMIAKVTKLKDETARKRDDLRDLISELEQIVENCDRATDAMESAADSLSELL